MLSGCQSEAHITSLSIRTENSETVDINFESGEMRYWDISGSEGPQTIQIDKDELKSYQEFVESFCSRVIKDRDKYEHEGYIDGNNYASSRLYWMLSITYDNGESDTLEAFQENYPDDWNDFIDRTNSFIGYDYLTGK